MTSLFEIVGSVKSLVFCLQSKEAEAREKQYLARAKSIEEQKYEWTDSYYIDSFVILMY